MMPKVTFRQLQFLVSLSRHLHFGQAADECCLTQSAFSIGIKKLENQLGLKLVDRSKKQIMLTAVGLRVAEQAEQIFNELQHFNEVVSFCRTPFTGKLRMGVIPTIAPFVLPKVLPKIKKRWEQLDLSIREDVTAQLHKELLEGKLDLILIALPYDLNGVDSCSLFKDHFKFVYNKNTKLFTPPYDERALPAASILLLEDGHCLRNHALSVCDTQHHKKVSPYTASSLHTLIQMVNNDLGVTFVTELAVAGGLIDKTQIAITDLPSKAYREIGLGWRKGSGRVDEFRQFAEIFSALAPKRKHKRYNTPT